MAATAYAQLADVQSHFTNITFGVSSDPDTTEIEEWLELYYSKINGLLSSKGISVPLDETTNPNAYHIAKNMNEMAVSALTAEAVYSGMDPADSNIADKFWKEYWDVWEQIEKNPRFMYDATVTRPAATSYAIEEYGDADDADQPRVDFDEKF